MLLISGASHGFQVRTSMLADGRLVQGSQTFNPARLVSLCELRPAGMRAAGTHALCKVLLLLGREVMALPAMHVLWLWLLAPARWPSLMSDTHDNTLPRQP
eukprot:278107-Rhodomonas_salina.3